MKTRWMIIILILSAISVGCTADPAAPAGESALTPTPLLAGYISTDYKDAASLRNQLALGILYLEETPSAVTLEQSGELLLLWQAYVALLSSDIAAPEETNAVQDQIAEVLNEEQLQAIAGMKLTNADLTDFYAEHGVVMPTPQPGITPDAGSGGKSDLSQEEREAFRSTAEALGTPVGSSSGSGQDRQNILFDLIIQLLSERAGK
ncbi:MAG: hypothetical protein ISS57_18505 [Anaerolineales bacterium]|nr:hypothetical protein [Anaerolineales bacterium]